MSTPSPQRTANELTVVLRAAGVAEFPMNVKAVALEISAQKYPDDPLTLIEGAPLPGFEGALTKAPHGKKGWGIIYNNAITSKGRLNFTLGADFDDGAGCFDPRAVAGMTWSPVQPSPTTIAVHYDCDMPRLRSLLFDIWRHWHCSRVSIPCRLEIHYLFLLFVRDLVDFRYVFIGQPLNLMMRVAFIIFRYLLFL